MFIIPVTLGPLSCKISTRLDIELNFKGPREKSMFYYSSRQIVINNVTLMMIMYISSKPINLQIILSKLHQLYIEMTARCHSTDIHLK